MERLKVLYQPVKFKRTKRGIWESGLKILDDGKITILDCNNKIVQNALNIEVDWFKSI